MRQKSGRFPELLFDMLKPASDVDGRTDVERRTSVGIHYETGAMQIQVAQRVDGLEGMEGAPLARW
jgi:hypothetical protein